jgi:hypothetical protein
VNAHFGHRHGFESLLRDANDALVANGLDKKGVYPSAYARPDNLNDIPDVISLELQRIERDLKKVEGEHANLDWLFQC